MDVNVTGTTTAGATTRYGKVSTFLEVAPVSHIIDLSVSSAYHQNHQWDDIIHDTLSGTSMSSDVIKALYEGTGSLMEMVDVHLLSMTVNCIHPPCLYSYFYSLENESNHENNDNIPLFMALAIGLAAAPLNGVVFPWSYDTIQVMGCIEDMYGSTTCTLEPYTPSTLSSGSNHTSHQTLDICDYINDIGSHLALLSKVGDALRLSQFVSAVVLEMIGRETRDGDNRECVHHTMNMIFEYIHNVLVHTEYFGFYPFPILQILYLTSRHSLVPSTSYITFNALYNEFNAFNEFIEFIQ